MLTARLGRNDVRQSGARSVGETSFDTASFGNKGMPALWKWRRNFFEKQPQAKRDFAMKVWFENEGFVPIYRAGAGDCAPSAPMRHLSGIE